MESRDDPRDASDAEPTSEPGAVPDAQDFATVYGELRRLAGAAFRRGGSTTLQPTGLVHEAWMKLRRGLSAIRDREHFLAVAALAMRQVLADHARAARAQRRAHDRATVTLDGLLAGGAAALPDVVDLDDALTHLARLNERHARVVELRFLAGLTIAETAAVLDVGHATVESDWAMARAWLRKKLAGR